MTNITKIKNAIKRKVNESRLRDKVSSILDDALPNILAEIDQLDQAFINATPTKINVFKNSKKEADDPLDINKVQIVDEGGTPLQNKVYDAVTGMSINGKDSFESKFAVRPGKLNDFVFRLSDRDATGILKLIKQRKFESIKELDVRKTHGDKRIENPATGNDIKLRTALKAKKGSAVYAKGKSMYNALKDEPTNEGKITEDYSQRARNFRVNLRKRLIGMKKGQKVSYGKAQYVKMVDGNFQIPKTGKVYGVEDIVQAMKRAVQPDIMKHRGVAGADMVNAYLKFEGKLTEAKGGWALYIDGKKIKSFRSKREALRALQLVQLSDNSVELKKEGKLTEVSWPGPSLKDLGMSSSVSKRRAGAELKQKLAGKRSDGMGKYTATIYGMNGSKRVELKSLNDLNKFSKFELDEGKLTEAAKYKKGQKVTFQMDKGGARPLKPTTGTISKVQRKGNSYLYTIVDKLGPTPVYEPEITGLAETKGAPKGHYFTASGNVVKGSLSKAAKSKGARLSDPKDKQRSKVPKATQVNEAEEYKYKKYVAKAFKDIKDATFNFRNAMGVKQLGQSDPKVKKQLESLHKALFALEKDFKGKGLTEGEIHEDRFGHPITSQGNQTYIQLEKLIKMLSGKEKRDAEKAFRTMWSKIKTAMEEEEQK